MTSRVPPQNLLAEASVMGAMLQQNSVIPEVMGVLEPSDLYSLKHRKAFEAILALFNEGRRVDAVILDAFLGDGDGRPAASELCQWADEALPSMAAHHACLVKDQSLRRQIIESVRRAIEEEIYSPDEEPLAIASKLISALSRLGNGTKKAFVPLAEVGPAALREIEAAYHDKNR